MNSFNKTARGGAGWAWFWFVLLLGCIGAADKRIKELEAERDELKTKAERLTRQYWEEVVLNDAIERAVRTGFSPELLKLPIKAD